MAETLFACNLCDSLCGLKVGVEGGKVTSIRGDDEDPISRGHICPKAVGLRELLEDPDRIRHPLVRDGAGFRRASWEEALDKAAQPLRRIRKQHGRDAVALYVGNPVVHSHGAALAAQLLTMTLRTKNRFDPSSQDSNPRTFACMQMYGAALTIPVPDLDRTDFLLILGANPAVSNGSMMVVGDAKARLRAIRARGGKIVVIDPRRTETATLADEHHFIRPGGDAALLLAMLHVILDDARPPADVRGLAALREAARAFPPERVAAAIGMSPEVIRDLARRFGAARTACAYARVGVCQNEFGPLANWLIEALNVATGRLGAVGGSMFTAPAADLARLERWVVGTKWGRWRSRVRGLPEWLGALPSAALLDEIATPGQGQVKALIVLAGNPVLTTPAGARLGEQLPTLEHIVAIDYYVNETTRHAHVILPPRHIFETGNFELLLHRFGVRNAVRYSPPIVATSDDTRTDWEIGAELVRRVVGPRIALPQRLVRAIPDRFVSFLLRTGRYRLSLDALREHPHGLDLGALEPGIRIPGKQVDMAPAVFVADLPRLATWVDVARAAGPVLIGRRHLRSNNSWMHNLRALTKGPDRATLMVHPLDAQTFGLVHGQHARVRSSTGELTAPVTITDEVMPGVVSLPHGFGARNANALTDHHAIEPIIGTAILNGLRVTVEPA